MRIQRRLNTSKCFLFTLGVAAINQYIYVIGGYDGSKQLATVERYDTENDKWEFVSKMKIARSALSVTVLDCKIYAMGKQYIIFDLMTRCLFLFIYFLGGYDGQNFLCNVEVYDPMLDIWEDGDPLTSGRSGHASAVCYQNPCMQNCHVMQSCSASGISSPSSSHS